VGLEQFSAVSNGLEQLSLSLNCCNCLQDKANGFGLLAPSATLAGAGWGRVARGSAVLLKGAG
jgi:hypothetical protein